jgi:arabinogalactan endo-1,4-beta-galactosidase
MASEGNGIYSYFTYLPSGFQGIFSILNDTSGQTYEPVPEACRSSVPGSRSFHVGRDDTIISFHWASCEPLIPPSQVRVTFRVQMNEDSDVSNGVYVTGDINNWEISSMEFEGNRIYGKSFMLPPGDDLLAYYYLTTNTWDNYSDYRESVPRECALKWNTDRAIAVPPRDTTVGHRWGSCLTIEEGLSEQEISSSDNRAYLVYPNPASGNCQIQMPDAERNIRFWLYCSDGALIFEDLIQNHTSEINMNLSDLAEGLYYFKLQHDETTVVKKIIVRR